MQQCVRRCVVGLIVLIVLGLIASACAALDIAGENINQTLSGARATMTTYDQLGNKIDSITALSMKANRESEFDSTDPDSLRSNEDSDVVRISVGDQVVHHVGSTMIIAQEGVVEVAGAPTQLELQNTDDGRPWLNGIYEDFRNTWGGKAKTIVVKSQDGHPIAVYAGDRVEIRATDIPKSTAFWVDGLLLLVYRADYTVYDTALLG